MIATMSGVYCLDRPCCATLSVCRKPGWDKQHGQLSQHRLLAGGHVAGGIPLLSSSVFDFGRASRKNNKTILCSALPCWSMVFLFRILIVFYPNSFRCISLNEARTVGVRTRLTPEWWPSPLSLSSVARVTHIGQRVLGFLWYVCWTFFF